MPIFEYHCHTCQERVELLIRSTGVQPVCPTCGNPLSDKLFSVPNVLTGRSQPPARPTCCGREEQCDEPACAHQDGCRYG